MKHNWRQDRESSFRIDKQMVVRFLQQGLELRRHVAFRPEVIESWPGETPILASEDDEAAFGSLAKLQARFPRARTHVFEQGGHHTLLFFPEAYVAALRGFLDGVLDAKEA